MSAPPDPVEHAETLYRAGRPSECLKFLEEFGRDRDRIPKLLWLRSLCLIASGRFEEARRTLEDPLLRAGLTAAMHRELAQAWETKGELEAALAEYGETLRSSPGLADDFFNRACVHEKLLRFEEALADLDAALELKPEDEGLALMRLVFLIEGGRADQVEAQCRRLAERHPGARRRVREILFFGRSIMSLRKVQRRWIDGRYEEALLLCDETLVKEPGSAAALCLKGLCLMSLDRLEEAKAALEAALSRAPGAPMPRKHLGMLRRRLGEAGRAVAEYDLALALDAQDGEILLERAEARLSLGDRAGALEDLRAAARLDPECAEVAERMIKDLGPEAADSHAAGPDEPLGPA